MKSTVFEDNIITPSYKMTARRIIYIAYIIYNFASFFYLVFVSCEPRNFNPLQLLRNIKYFLKYLFIVLVVLHNICFCSFWIELLPNCIIGIAMKPYCPNSNNMQLQFHSQRTMVHSKHANPNSCCIYHACI